MRWRIERRAQALAVATALTLACLLVAGETSLWHRHIVPDVWIFSQRAASFSAHWTWADLHDNEYQPGALFFFLLPAALSAVGPSYECAFISVNAALLAAHVAILQKEGSTASPWIALALFFAAGPISLFRFDLFVSLLVLVALSAWNRGRAFESGIWLGIAVATKVYPLVLVPPLLLSLVRRRDLRSLRLHLAGIASGAGAIVLAFIVLGGRVAAVVESLLYHALKPVSLQSVWAAIGVALTLAHGTLPTMVDDYGIHGIALPTAVRWASALSFLVLAGTLIVRTSLVTIRGGNVLRSDIPLLHAVLQSLIVSSTAIQPQYLLWPIGLAALLTATDIRSGQVSAVIVFFALALLTTQILFPVLYFSEVAMFREGRPDLPLLGLYFLAAGALIGLLTVSWCISWTSLRQAAE